MANPQLVVVIPCHDEPDLLTTLDSLWRCRLPPCGVEVVVVINGSESDPPAVQAQNQQTCVAASAWMDAHQEAGRLYYLLFEPMLPTRSRLVHQRSSGIARPTVARCSAISGRK